MVNRNVNVNGEEYIRALKEKVLPDMKRWKSTNLISDGCGVDIGHTAAVKKVLDKAKVDLYPLASEEEGGLYNSTLESHVLSLGCKHILRTSTNDRYILLETLQ